MAYPQWLTPAGNLGIVPSAEYYQFALDAYDTAGGTLAFSKLSGVLPPGLQITTAGVIQGIPVSTAGPDLNQEYLFTVRVKNLSDNLISDRSFSLTITNVAPPVIVPRDVDLGEYFDGQVVSIQLEATEYILGDNLTWKLKSGVIPPGLTVSTDGLISGYINLIPTTGPSSNPGWDLTNWDGQYTFSGSTQSLGWQFNTGTIAKNFEFSIEVSDGARTDVSTYAMYVVPKLGTTADSNYIKVDTTIINGIKFTVDTGSRHDPIIITTQNDLEPARQGDWYTYQISALDLDDDILNYIIPNLASGAYDEQANVLLQLDYLGRSFVTNGNINVGVTWGSNTESALTSGDEIQVLAPFTDITSLQTTYVWYDATVNNHAAMRLTGNTIIVANVGEFITQTVDSANATITSITTTTGNIELTGGVLYGTIELGGAALTVTQGDLITQVGTAGNAVVLQSAISATTISVRYYNTNFSSTFVYPLPSTDYNLLKVNGTTSLAFPVSFDNRVETTLLFPDVGDYITQASSGANATVTKAHSALGDGTYSPLVIEVEFNSGPFITGSGNIALNGANIELYPAVVTYSADVNFIYNNANTFRIGTDDTALIYHNGLNTFAQPVQHLSVGVDVEPDPNTQGTVGFDEGYFDQGTLALPGTLSMNLESGWITGYLPTQTANEQTYNFEVQVYKRDYPSYSTNRLLSLTIYGDLYNTIEWLTPNYLGTIQNGAVSDLQVTAISTKGKQIYYYLTPDTYINVPQGLRLQPDGLISGRVSFELFSLDAGTTTFDSNILTGDPTTTFDQTFEFSITAQTYDQSTSSTRRFSVLVRGRNLRPYENLYLQAQLNSLQRIEFRDIIQNQSVFDPDLIYRTTDPWFGLTRNIRTLFLPGLNPNSLNDYAAALATNHFSKRLLFGQVKSAVARADGVYDVIENARGITVGTYNVYTRLFVPTEFGQGYVVSSTIPAGTTVGDQTVKYEVVYAEMYDENSNPEGRGPTNTINLNGEILNPYYNDDGAPFKIATPNAFTNMNDVVVDNIGYQDKGVLPDWMSSIQLDGTQLGFIRATVLAYVKPGYGETVAWRFNELGYNLNEINFTVEQYNLDSGYTNNFDLTANAYITSRETTFDRYPPLNNIFKPIGTVDYAVNDAFQDINQRTVSEISAGGGLDGITSFKDGQKLVFFEQEFATAVSISDSYNQGWTNSIDPWDDPNTWDNDFSWDPTTYIPGYREWLSSKITTGANVAYSVPNQRIGIWQINIDSSNYVTLTLANVNVGITAIAANTTGYGSNVTVSSTENLFVGMPVVGTGLANTTVITSIIGSNIVIYPAGTYGSGRLTCMPTVNYNDTIYVRNGYTHGGVNIYYDPLIKTDKTVPNWSKIPQQIKTTSTVFDGDGTKFYDFRDNYVIPGQGEQALRFPRINVFD